MMKKKRKTKALLKEYYQLYLILIPAVVYFILFNYIPMYGVSMAFREYQFDKGLFFSPWVGLKYFEAFFSYYNFWGLIRNTLLINFFKLIIAFPFPIIFALMINEVRQPRLKKAFQTVSYLPHFISWVVAIIIFQQFLSLDGIFNEIRESMGLEPIFYMNETSYFYPIMFLSYVWKTVGFNAIIYLAALTSIDPSLYEAATVDGASKMKQILYISIPSILPLATMLFVLNLGTVLSAGYDQIYLLQTPGNKGVSEILDTYVIEMGFRGGEFGYATAAGLFQSVIGCILVVATNLFTKKMSQSEANLF